MKYARKCSVTGEGMNEGWLWGDGCFYTKYLNDTLTECLKDKDEIIGLMSDRFYEAYNEPHDQEEASEWEELTYKVKHGEDLTSEELLTIAYRMDYLYYTDWEEDDYQYEEVNGKLEEIE